MFTKYRFYTRLLQFAVLTALTVVVLGAYTRLSDAGLGCPDWPGCYGHLIVPQDGAGFERPLEAGKAWKEMIHRYVAGTLGLLVLLITYLVYRGKTNLPQGRLLPTLLLGTVIFQALLGMWTVTMALSPMIVTAHLIGGFTTLILIWLLLLNQSNHRISNQAITTLKGLATFSLLIVIGQILLGGWTSTNYAAWACGSSFPTCAGQWWPDMDFSSAFTLNHETGKNYEFGVLENTARTAIQMTHRIGATITLIVVSFFALRLLRIPNSRIKSWAVIILILLFSQLTLGILNVMLSLPIEIAVAHNLIAALLLLSIIAMTHASYKTL